MFLFVGFVGSGRRRQRRLDRQPEEVATDPLQGHGFETAEIEQAIVQGSTGSLDETGRGVLEVHAVKPPYGTQALAAVALAQTRGELGELGGRGSEQLLFAGRLHPTLAPAAIAMRLEREALAEPGLDPRVARHLVMAVEHDDRVERLTYLQPAPHGGFAVR